MKNNIFIIFLFFFLLSKAQSVSLVNCIDEGKFEYLKLKENLDENNYLLYSRSILPDSINFSPFSYWLHKIDADGNIVWKNQIPNTDKGYYNVYFPNWVGYLTFKINDFPNKIYTKLDDELIFHYAYYDSIVSDSSGLYLGNDILTFAVMSHSNGTYRSSFINVDTLISNPMDTSVQITNCLVNKINDSIYQMAVQYSKSIYWFWTNIYAYSLTNFYTININSNQVIKKVNKDNYKNSIFSKNNQFYVLRNEYVSFGVDNLFLSKINLNGEVDTTVLLMQTAYGGSFIENNENSKIQILSTTDFEPNKQNSQLVSIDTTSFLSSITNYSQFIDDVGIINGYESMRFVDYPLFNNSNYYDFSSLNIPYPKYLDFTTFKKTGNTRFLLHSYEYYDSTNTNKSARFITRLNLENGLIEKEKELKYPSGAYSDELFRDDIFSGNDILVPHDSVTEIIYNTADTVFQSVIFEKRLFSLYKLDSNLDTIWTISLPDSVFIDSMVYYCGFGQFQSSKNLTFYPVNYNNQFIVGLSYERLSDSTGNNSSAVINYFFINNNTGQIRDMQLPAFLLQRRLAFFNSANNDLSIITQDSCNDNMDISIYKYQNIISNINLVEPNTSFNFTLYPNPANSTLQINFSHNQKYKNALLQIVNVSGLVLAQTNVELSDVVLVATEHLSNGMYFLRLTAEDESVTKKFQVIH